MSRTTPPPCIPVNEGHAYIMLAEGYGLGDGALYATMFCTRCSDVVIVASVPANAVTEFGQRQ